MEGMKQNQEEKIRHFCGEECWHREYAPRENRGDVGGSCLAWARKTIIGGGKEPCFAGMRKQPMKNSPSRQKKPREHAQKKNNHTHPAVNA